jgi:hypothetical protein
LIWDIAAAANWRMAVEEKLRASMKMSTLIRQPEREVRRFAASWTFSSPVCFPSGPEAHVSGPGFFLSSFSIDSFGLLVTVPSSIWSQGAFPSFFIPLTPLALGSNQEQFL